MLPTSTALSRHAAVNLINALAYSERVGLHLTFALDITWSRIEGFKPALLHRTNRRFIRRLQAWYVRHGLPCAFLWVMENSDRSGGLHAHYMLHCPLDLFEGLRDAVPSLIPGYRPNYSIHIVRGDRWGGNIPSPRRTPTARAGCLQYMLKGLTRASFNNNGRRVQFAEAIGIEQRKGPQGVITGPRYGVCHLLGPIARKAAGFIDVHDVSSLRAIIPTKKDRKQKPRQPANDNMPQPVTASMSPEETMRALLALDAADDARAKNGRAA